LYASRFMYEAGNLNYEYGSPQFWAFHFAARMLFRAMSELFGKRRGREEIPREQRDEIWKETMENWALSFRSDDTYRGKNLFKVIGAKSDITGNFPVIVGVRKGEIRPLPMNHPSVALYEHRTDQTITPDRFTHIQVPIDAIPEVSELVRQSGQVIPVIPIEFVELINSQTPFSELIKPH